MVSCLRERNKILTLLFSGKNSALYWENNKMRLNKLVEGLKKYNPGMKVPFLFTYFPDSSSTELTLKKVKTIHAVKYTISVLTEITLFRYLNYSD